jgi:hypothetical protein
LPSYSSLERLDYERKVLFSSTYSLGARRMRQEVQSTPKCLGVAGEVPCVENRRWTWHDVMYATVNIQGSCNNLCDTKPDPAEYTKRNAADIAWLQDSFAQAEVEDDAAIMVVGQADPGFDLSDGTRAPLREPKSLVEVLDAKTLQPSATDGFKDFLTAFRALTIEFRKPVVYVHGDSHYFRVDKPLQDSKGQRVENFTRVETFGDNQANGTNDAQWVKAYVDPDSREVFAFQPQVVPANRVTLVP